MPLVSLMAMPPLGLGGLITVGRQSLITWESSCPGCCPRWAVTGAQNNPSSRPGSTGIQERVGMLSDQEWDGLLTRPRVARASGQPRNGRQRAQAGGHHPATGYGRRGARGDRERRAHRPRRLGPRRSRGVFGALVRAVHVLGGFTLGQGEFLVV